MRWLFTRAPRWVRGFLINKNMQIQNYILLLEAALLFALAFYVLLRNPGQKVPQAFFVMTFGAGMWVGSNGIFEITQQLFFGKATFIGAILIVTGFIYLSTYFPYQHKIIKSLEHIIISIPAIFLSVILYSTDWFIVRVSTIDTLEQGVFYHVFAVYYLIYWFWGIYNLFRKYKTADGLHYWQLRYLFLAIIFSLFAGIATNLILPWLFKIQNLGWVGPMFSIVFFGFLSYIVFKKEVR